MITFLYLLIAALIFFVIGYLLARGGCKSSNERYLAKTPIDPVSHDDGNCDKPTKNPVTETTEPTEPEKQNAQEEAEIKSEEAQKETQKTPHIDPEEQKEVKKAEEIATKEDMKEEPAETQTEINTGAAPEGLLTAPRDGKKDNLTRIKGIGVKIDEALNGIGIYHFDQIAAWDESNMAWADSQLAFPGRAKRDDWVGQAKLLAAGAETEFSKRVDNEEVASSKKHKGL